MLAALLLLAQDPPGAGLSAPPKTTLADDKVCLAMTHDSRMPVVEAMLNGRGPYRFILDTGAGGHGRIDRALAAELQLPVVGEARASDGTGVNDRSARLVSVDSVELGAARFEQLQFLEGDYSQRIPAGKPVSGVLGYGLFTGLLWTLDYPGNAVILGRGELAPDAPHVLGYDGARGIPVVPIRLGEHELVAHVDSGSMGGLTLPRSWMHELALRGAPMARGSARTTNNEVPIVMAEFEDALSVAGHSFTRTSADFAELFRDANLGYEVLRRFTLTIDARNRRIQFARGAEQELVLAPPPPRFGLMAMPADAGLAVDSVVPGSRAELSGLKSGDLILDVDGRSVLALQESGELGDLLGSGAPLRLRVRRGANVLELTVP